MRKPRAATRSLGAAPRTNNTLPVVLKEVTKVKFKAVGHPGGSRGPRVPAGDVRGEKAERSKLPGPVLRKEIRKGD